jgi:myosin heavy subunit
MFKPRAGVVRSDNADKQEETQAYVPDAVMQYKLDTNAHIAKLGMLESQLTQQVADLTKDMTRANDEGNTVKAVKLWGLLEKEQKRLNDVSIKIVEARASRMDLDYQAASTTELSLQQSQMRAMKEIGQRSGVGSIDDARRAQVEFRAQRAEQTAVQSEMQRMKDEDAAAESEAAAASAGASGSASALGGGGTAPPAAMIEFLKNQQLRKELNRPAVGTSGRGQVSSLELRIMELQKQGAQKSAQPE